MRSIQLHFNLVIILGQEFVFVWYKFNLTITICYNFSYAFINTKFPYEIKTTVYLINQTFHSWINFKASPIRTKKDFHESFHPPSSTSTIENMPLFPSTDTNDNKTPSYSPFRCRSPPWNQGLQLSQIKFLLHLGKQETL